MNSQKCSNLAMPVAVVIPLIVSLLSPRTALAHPPGVTEWVSVSSDGTGANNQRRHARD
jgi:hypothetical protein